MNRIDPKSPPASRTRCSGLTLATLLFLAACSGDPSVPGTTGNPSVTGTTTTDEITPDVAEVPRDSAAPTPSEVPSTTTMPELIPTVEFEVDRSVVGYAGQAGLTGGIEGKQFLVTSTADSGEGTYRDALSSGDRYIRFDSSLDGSTIELDDPVEASGSNLTIDGSGIDITVSGKATRFTGTNIVVAGMNYRFFPADENMDAITFREAQEEQVIGLFGNSFESAADGLVDVIWNEGHDTYLTACGNQFLHHDKAMLIDSGDDDKEGGRYFVTLCRNHWYDVYQRAPLSRRALVHQFNSVFEAYGRPDGDGGGSKAGGVGDGRSQHRLENNIAIPRVNGSTTFDGSTVSEPRTEWAAPQLDGDGAVAIDGTLLATVDEIQATEETNRVDDVFRPPYDYELVPASSALTDVIRTTAGTCVATSAMSVNPCAPLLIAVETLPILLSIRADGILDIERVSVVIDGRSVDLDPVDEEHWGGELSGAAGFVGEVHAVLELRDGRAVESDPIIVAFAGNGSPSDKPVTVVVASSKP